jgi:hypothetical protein
VTRFFGREQELERLAHWLRDPSVRLITLSGAGGAGKTRLAIEAATRAARGDGAPLTSRVCGPWFVPLADRAGAPGLWPAEREVRERSLTLIRAALGDDGIETAWAEGRALVRSGD